MGKIENAKITRVDLSMEDHGVLVLELILEGCGWGVTFGNRVLGKGYLDADPQKFKGSSKGIEEIMRVMDTVGVARFNDMKGKYVRVEINGWGRTITKIGHIIEDKWFDYNEFYPSTEEEE